MADLSLTQNRITLFQEATPGIALTIYTARPSAVTIIITLIRLIIPGTGETGIITTVSMYGTMRITSLSCRLIKKESWSGVT